jgi:hypothetical protein
MKGLNVIDIGIEVDGVGVIAHQQGFDDRLAQSSARILYGQVVDNTGASIRWEWRAARFADYLLQTRLKSRNNGLRAIEERLFGDLNVIDIGIEVDGVGVIAHQQGFDDRRSPARRAEGLRQIHRPVSNPQPHQL